MPEIRVRVQCDLRRGESPLVVMASDNHDEDDDEDEDEHGDGDG